METMILHRIECKKCGKGPHCCNCYEDDDYFDGFDRRINAIRLGQEQPQPEMKFPPGQKDRYFYALKSREDLSFWWGMENFRLMDSFLYYIKIKVPSEDVVEDDNQVAYKKDRAEKHFICLAKNFPDVFIENQCTI